MRLGMCALVCFVLLAHSATAQVLYQTSFDDGSGWALEPPLDGNPGWKVDALPASTPFGAFRSPPSSLNYNNDVDYEFATASQLELKAVSPWIDVSAATGIPVVTLWCNNRTEEGACDVVHELFRVLVTATSGECFAWSEPQGKCATSEGWPDWHRHSLAMFSNPGMVQAVFDTRVDSIANSTEGLFIDDFAITNHRAPSVFCTAKTTSLGCTPKIGWTGLPSLDDGVAFRITASKVLSHSLGILVYGVNGPAATPFFGGVLCVAGTVHRTPAQSSGGGPPPTNCSGSFSFDFLAWQASGADPTLVEGVQVEAQYWYRDPGDAFTVGLTDAVEFLLIP